jgi:hypothetical protein
MNEYNSAGQLGALAPTPDRLIIHHLNTLVCKMVEYNEDEDSYTVLLTLPGENGTLIEMEVPPGEADNFQVGQEWQLDAALERGA